MNSAARGPFFSSFANLRSWGTRTPITAALSTVGMREALKSRYFSSLRAKSFSCISVTGFSPLRIAGHGG